MNKTTKNFFKYFLFVFLAVFMLNTASADATTTCNLQISLINQDPNPAIPGDYVDVLFQVSGVDNSDCQGAMFELIPSYPFSLDEPGLRTLNGNTWVANYKTEWNIPYKLRVDKAALDGDTDLEVHYAPGYYNPGYSLTKYFNITIKDSRTNFDAVIQEISGADISIALANTGKYAANSVVVRIPEQESFKAVGTNGQMVGNLESGDYTIVSFSLSQTSSRNFQNMTNYSRTGSSYQTNLKFDIYYTDNLGERRIVNMQLPLNLNTNVSMAGIAGQAGFRTSSASSNGGNNWTLIITLVLLAGIAFFVYKRYPLFFKELYHNSVNRFKNVFGRSKPQDYNKNVPDWVQKSRDKWKAR